MRAIHAHALTQQGLISMLTVVNAAAVLALEPKLEADPRSTLLMAVPVLIASQTLSSFITSRDLFSSLLSGVLSLLLTPLTSLIFILFGAPLTSLLAETALCAAVVTTITVQPMVARYGIEISVWRRAFALDLPFTDVYAGFLGGITGAWLGAVPIALDWDRPWQQWPITVLLGAAVGVILGNFAALVTTQDPLDKYGEKRIAKANKKTAKSRQAVTANPKAKKGI